MIHLRTLPLWGLLCLAFLLTFASCDDGPLYPKDDLNPDDGRTIQVDVRFKGLDNWPSNTKYSVLAGIVDANTHDFARGMYKHVRRPSEGDVSTITFKQVPDTLNKVVVVVSTKSNRIVHTYFSEVIGADVSKEVNAGDVELQPLYAYVQEDVFNQNCIGCHGDADRVSAGLDLTVGRSYDMLVGRRATTDADFLRVKSGDADSSYLYRILADETLPANAHGYNHPQSIDITPEMLSLIIEWIADGAQP